MMLPQLELTLPNIMSAESVDFYKNETERIAKITKNAGRTSLGFEKRVERLRGLSVVGEDVSDHINSLADIRAVAYLWDTDEQFLTGHPISGHIIKKIYSIAPIATRLSLSYMTSLYFNRYDLLGDGLQHLRKYLDKQFAERNGKPLPASLKRFSKQALLLLHKDAPKKVVASAIKDGLELTTILKKCGVPHGVHNRFSTICQTLYYVNTLKKLKVGEGSPVLSEIQRSDIAETPYSKAKLVGHLAIEILIDKCIDAEKDLPDTWRDVILSIGKDPRVPKSNPAFRKWWSVIGSDRTRWMRQWLSRLDLKVFLDVLEDYANTSGKDELQRMFPARKRFLLGLFDRKIVQQSRLYLGSRAIAFLTKRYKKDTLPYFAKQSENDKAVIYLDLGKVHMIEGTHSFPLLLMDVIPKKSNILSYDLKYFDVRELNQNLIQNHEEMKKKKAADFEHERIIHHPNLHWQAKAIKALKKYGIYVNPGDVLTREDHKEFIKKSKYSL
jgi:hypothetical protein